MKKEMVGKLFVLIFISLFFVSLIASGVIGDPPAATSQPADTTNQPTTNEAANVAAATEAGKSVQERISDWWNSTTLTFSEQSKNLLSKILLMTLVVLIIYSIMSFMPFAPRGKEYINWLIAIIVGVLSFLFVSVDNIRYILMTYEGLGISLTTVFPLVVILVFSYRLRRRYPGIANLLNPALFIGFLLYVGSRWLTYKPSGTTLPELAYIYPLTFAITVIWLILERKIWHYFFKKELLGDIEKFKNVTDAEINAEINRLQSSRQFITDKRLRDIMEDRIKDLIDLLNP